MLTIACHITSYALVRFLYLYLYINLTMNSPMTLEQATKTCEEYQFLIGQPYDASIGFTTPILAVIVAPYEEDDQQVFLDEYERKGHANLKRYNAQKGYAAIAVATYIPDVEIYLWKDVRVCVNEHQSSIC